MKRLIQLLLFFLGFLSAVNVSAQEASLQTNLLESNGIMSFRPMDIMVKPTTLSKVWVDKPIPLSFYTQKEVEGQIYINQKVADGIITYSPLAAEKDWTEIDFEDITPYTWKWIDFELPQLDGTLTKAHLLRPHWWIEQVGADSVGKKVYLNMPELGSRGWATVKAIRVNQLDTRFWDEQRKGDYVSRPITGKFEHESNDVYHLYYANNSKPLGVTGSHPIWSLDRNGWVGAAELKIGEKVKTKEGETTLTSRQNIQGKQTVYNLEIYKDHNFHVSEDEILVHNSCIDNFLERMGDVLDNFAGDIDMGWYDGETLLLSVDAILKNPKAPSGAAFDKLTEVAEAMARENGLQNVRIDFNMVVNPILATDEMWARKYGYYFSKTVTETGTTNVTWEKVLK